MTNETKRADEYNPQENPEAEKRLNDQIAKGMLEFVTNFPEKPTLIKDWDAEISVVQRGPWVIAMVSVPIQLHVTMSLMRREGEIIEALEFKNLSIVTDAPLNMSFDFDFKDKRFRSVTSPGMLSIGQDTGSVEIAPEAVAWGTVDIANEFLNRLVAFHNAVARQNEKRELAEKPAAGHA